MFKDRVGEHIDLDVDLCDPSLPSSSTLSHHSNTFPPRSIRYSKIERFVDEGPKIGGSIAASESGSSAVSEVRNEETGPAIHPQVSLTTRVQGSGRLLNRNATFLHKTEKRFGRALSKHLKTYSVPTGVPGHSLDGAMSTHGSRFVEATSTAPATPGSRKARAPVPPGSETRNHKKTVVSTILKATALEMETNSFDEIAL